MAKRVSAGKYKKKNKKLGGRSQALLIGSERRQLMLAEWIYQLTMNNQQGRNLNVIRISQQFVVGP